MKNLEKKKDEEIQAKKTEINNMAIEKKKLIAEFEETKKLTAGMKDSVRKADIFTFTCPQIVSVLLAVSDGQILLFIEQLQGCY